MNRFKVIILLLLLLIATLGLVKAQDAITMVITPAVEIDTSSEVLKSIVVHLSKKLEREVHVMVPESYQSAVHAIGQDEAQFGLINSTGYLRGKQLYGLRSDLIALRAGKPIYYGQILAHRKSGILALADLNGKKFAFGDQYSASGFIYPSMMLKKAKVNLKESVVCQNHEEVVRKIYNQEVDAGATYHAEREGGLITDARGKLLKEYPDVVRQINIITLTDPIPNDVLVFNKNVNPELSAKINAAFLEYAASPVGKRYLKKLFNIDGFDKIDEKLFKDLEKNVNKLFEE